MKAELNYIRIAPRKMRLVAGLIRGKNIAKARDVLKFSKNKGAEHMFKLLNSAAANARNNFGRDSETLYVSRLTVDQGPVYKRYMPRARGTASMIRKKTSHVTLVLEGLPAGKAKR